MTKVQLTWTTGTSSFEIQFYEWLELPGVGPVEARTDRFGPREELAIVRDYLGKRHVVEVRELEVVLKAHCPPWPFRRVGKRGGAHMCVPA